MIGKRPLDYYPPRDSQSRGCGSILFSAFITVMLGYGVYRVVIWILHLGGY